MVFVCYQQLQYSLLYLLQWQQDVIIIILVIRIAFVLARSFGRVTNSFGRTGIHPVRFNIIISDNLSNACYGDYSFLVIFFLFLLLFRFPVFHPFCLVPITVTIGTVSVFPFIIVYLLMLSILSQLYVHNLQSQLLGGHYNPSLTRLQQHNYHVLTHNVATSDMSGRGALRKTKYMHNS